MHGREQNNPLKIEMATIFIKLANLLHLNVSYFKNFLCLVLFVFCCSFFIQQVSSQEPSSINLIPLESNSIGTSNASSNTQGVLGIRLEYITPEISDILGLNITGAIITDVHPFSPASSAGIRAGNNLTQIGGKEVLLGGDILLKINNSRISQFQSNISSALQENQRGENVTLTLFRNGQPQKITLPLIDKNDLPTFIQRLSGKYVHPEADLQMYLPQEWSGFQTRGLVDFGTVGTNITDVSDFGKQNMSISFLVTNTSEMEPNVIGVSGENFGGGSGECNTLSKSYTTLNGSVLLDVVNQCDNLGHFTKTKYIMGATEQNLFIITFRANSSDLYDTNLEKFNKSLDSIKIEKPMDIRKMLANLTQDNLTTDR